MKHALFIGVFLFSLLGNAQSIETIRKEFHKAVLNPEMSEDFHAYMKNCEQSSPRVQAYKAVSEAMLAQVVWNPFTKLSQVRKYREAMTIAVESSPDNIEIRFLRLAIEHNLPPFLGMSEHVNEDLSLILEHVSSEKSISFDPGYTRYICYFLEHSGLCSSDQVLAMRQTFEEQNSL